MINVVDNFIPKKEFKELQEYCNNSEFNIVGKDKDLFSVIEIPDFVKEYFYINGLEISLMFIRRAYSGFDNDLRIHADNIVQGSKTSYASVLYINETEGVTDNGTCFYEHKIHGVKLTEECTNEEFDRLLNEDSNDISKWKKLDYVSSRPNRLLTYDSNYFHSKFPKNIDEGIRIVLVVFYK